MKKKYHFKSRYYGAGRYDEEYEQGNDYPIGYVRWTEKEILKLYLIYFKKDFRCKTTNCR